MEKHRAASLTIRGGLPRFAAKWRRRDKVTVAFLGGSITEGAGASDANATSWRALTERYLKESFGGGERVRCINAGVGGTTSVFGAHRLYEHVLREGPVDLLFVEFSVNDENLGRTESLRGMEGIVRQCARLSPGTEICFVYTASDKNLAEELSPSIAAQEEAATHYGLPSVNYAASILALIREGRAEWERLAPDHVHPNDAGHSLYAGYMRSFLEAVLTKPEDAGERPNEALPPLLLESNYEFAAMTDAAAEIPDTSGFRFARLEGEALMNWRYDTGHLLAETASASLAFTVQGRRAGVCILCGPDTGIFEYAVNGGPFQPVNLFDEWCPLAYRPVIALFPEREERGTMTVTVRATGRKDERSSGTGLRLLKLLSN